MTDHSIYLAENFTDFVHTPGFPYLRIHPALLIEDYPVQLSATEEQVLLVMHSTSNNLLLVSNRNVFVYKIPRYKPFLERLGGVGVKVALGLIPGVGQALEVADKLGEGRENFQSWGKLLGGLTGKAKKERLEDLQRAAERMPTKKELEDLTWDTRNENTLLLILCYRDRILLENGFEWKATFKTSLGKSDKTQNNIAIDSAGIVFHLNGKSISVPFVRKKFDSIAIAKVLIERCHQELASAGWSVESDDKKIILKDIR